MVGQSSYLGGIRLRPEGMALQRPVPEDHLALQPEIWEGPALLLPHPFRGCDQSPVRQSLQPAPREQGTVIDDCEMLAAMLENTSALDAKIAVAQEEIDTVVAMNKALIREHAVTGIEQSAFDREAKELDERLRKANARLDRLKAEKQDRLMRACGVKKYVENLRGQAGPIEVWNEQAWCLLVTQVTVHADGSAEFLFRGENRITVK